MKLNLRQIKDASQCFRRFRGQYPEWADERTKEAKIAERVIQKCYIRAMETTFKPNWQSILGWVDREVFINVDVDDTESWKAGRLRSEQILSFLNAWYKQTLLPEHVPAYSGLTLSTTICDSIVESTVPVIKVSEPPVISTISSIVQTLWQLYNDIEVRGQLYLVAQTLDVDSVCYQRLTIGPRGGITDQVVYSTKKELAATRRMLRAVVRAIRQGADYPIVSERCNNCSFRKKCLI